MASYLDQIPKQLSARRKAFRAARSNPALLAHCWAIVRAIANNMYEYARNTVIAGCTFPDRPIDFSVEEAAFLNFGSTPRLLMADAAWIEAESAGSPPPEAADARPAPVEEARVRRLLSGLAASYGVDHAATRVYSFEPWLQDMYRDRLDVDFAVEIQWRMDSLNAYMDTFPKSIAATGLNPRLTRGVIDAFNLFKTITASSHQLDREKMSFVDRRSYVSTVEKIELVMAGADKSLGAADAGRSVVRKQFARWKEANYEMMSLTRQLRSLWSGTGIDDRVQQLVDLVSAAQTTLNRCGEEAGTASPQLPVFRADNYEEKPLTRAEVAAAFHSLTLYDMVAGGNSAAQAREVRKMGPLAVVVMPGSGRPRYSAEMRGLSVSDDEESWKKPRDTASPGDRDAGIDRRVRYPLNCLIMPLWAERESLGDDLADAWLEYNQAAFPAAYKEYLDAARTAAPSSFLPPDGKDARSLPPTHSRRALSRLTAAFARWAHDGSEPDGEGLPGFDHFRDMVLGRLNSQGFLVPIRYRPLTDLYSEAGPKRRMEMWKRVLGPRFALDRQLVAASVLMKDWNSLRENLKLLPACETKDNSSLASGFAKVADTDDPFAGHKAAGFFSKFLADQPDLKSALATVENQAAIEADTLREQAESLGEESSYDQMAETILRRLASQIREKRLAANAHIDHYLTGLMYAMEGNLEAAEGAFTKCLDPADRRAEAAPLPAAVPEEIGQEWFEANLQPREGRFAKRYEPGKDGMGMICSELIHYNMGIVYRLMNRPVEAAMCFRGVLDSAAPGESRLYLRWAEAHLQALRNGMAETQE